MSISPIEVSASDTFAIEDPRLSNAYRNRVRALIQKIDGRWDHKRLHVAHQYADRFFARVRGKEPWPSEPTAAQLKQLSFEETALIELEVINAIDEHLARLKSSLESIEA